MEVSKTGLSIIKHYESLHDGDLSKIGLQPKMCPAGIWTEGYGHAITWKGQFVKGIANKELAYKLSRVYTEAEAEALLIEDTNRYNSLVSVALKKLKFNPTQNQFDALVSLCFNCGMAPLAPGLSIPKSIASGVPDQIKRSFGLWNKSNGKVLPGLVKRRATEGILFTDNKLIFF